MKIINLRYGVRTIPYGKREIMIGNNIIYLVCGYYRICGYCLDNYSMSFANLCNCSFLQKCKK